MTLKWVKIIAVFGIFILCFPFHFMYDWFSNSLFSIFFPVNESIFEHMKMLFSASIVYGAIDYFLLKLFKLKRNNYLVSLFISSLVSIPIFLIIYLPFYYFIGEAMVLNILILFIAVCISQIISYYVLKSDNFKSYGIVSVIGIVLVYIIFGLLTYYPPINDLFFDPTNEKYGINTYNVWAFLTLFNIFDFVIPFKSSFSVIFSAFGCSSSYSFNLS